MDIGSWLQSLNLSQLDPVLREKGIDESILLEMTKADFRKLGIESKYHQKLIDGISALRRRHQADNGETQPQTTERADLNLAAQRRQLTVMFCDLVGSTELSSKLDPEDMQEVVGSYLSCCKEGIEKTGGFVAKYLGDGVLAYFGYPQAHENDPERAIRAALDIREAVQKLPDGSGSQLAVRIGIATGLVVVGDLIGSGWSEERSVVGETPNLAARLQSIAPTNAIAVSNATRRLAAGLFEYRDLGPISLKGLPHPEAVWEVVGANPNADRFEARHDLKPSPMLGRERELRLILAFWEERSRGQGHVLGILGEPGIGKSRLIYEFRKQISAQPHVWIEGGGAQGFGNTPYYAIVRMIRRMLGRRRQLSPDEYFERLERSLSLLDMDVNLSLPIIAELIGIPTPTYIPPITMGADQKRSSLKIVLTEWLARTASRWPTALVIEDVHWVDPSTVEILESLVQRAPAGPFLVLYTSRDDAPLPLSAGPHHTCISLNRLDSASSRRLVISTANQKLSPELLDEVVSRADGVPLFAEELAHLVTEHDRPLDEREIPSTLSDLLMARLDQQGPAKQVAQLASVIGREVQLQLLTAVSGVGEDALSASLNTLVNAGVMYSRGVSPDLTYLFKHSLIQDAAYTALLKSQRRDIHKRVATVITEQFPDLAAAHPEVVARHWTMADEFERARSAWEKAGHAASSRRAFKEAQSAYEEAIALLGETKGEPAGAGSELALRGALAGILQITRGYSAPETIAASTRARQLAEAGGNLSQQIRHASGLWAASSSAGDYMQASRYADQILQLAQADRSPANFAVAHMIQMTSRYRIGDFVGAEEFYVSGVPHFGLQEFCRTPGVAAQTFGNAALVAWSLGDENEAGARSKRGLLTSTQNENPYDLAFAQSMCAVLAVLTANFDDAELMAHQSNELALKHGFPQFAAISQIVLGRVRAESGHVNQSISMMSDGLKKMAEIRSRVALTRYLTWFAEVLLLAGSYERAIETLDEALLSNPQELFFRPESLRIRGDTHLKMGLVERATEDLLEAVTLSKKMGAKQFHSRASASFERLARL